jgi:hypothetical protein
MAPITIQWSKNDTGMLPRRASRGPSPSALQNRLSPPSSSERERNDRERARARAIERERENERDREVEMEREKESRDDG